jgi:hypothetical protein
MALQQAFEGGFILDLDKPLQEIAVRQLIASGTGNLPEVAKHMFERGGGHA